jgi:ubiquinol-cytochrome c reductase cytochrome b subunit
LRNDPQTQGPKLFRQHCAACHSHFDPAAGDDDSPHSIVVEKPTAPNLWRIGTRDWVSGILDPEKISGPHYFGNTAHKEGDMVVFVQDTIGTSLNDLKGDELAAYRRKIEDAAIALEAEAGLSSDARADEGRIAAGRDAIVNELTCIDCHKFHDSGEAGLAPDLTGHASRNWLMAFIANPAHERFYPETNDRMPAFAPDRLSPDELKLVVDWLRGEWYEPAARSGPTTP